jgi:hypothetical protein
MSEFLDTLRRLRWDDHRYYHHSRINQSLHFISANCFLVAYALLPFDPSAAALLGWGVAMVARQSGHFFFEPKGFDDVNQATHEHKEAIKVGYNLRRKVFLHIAWAASPLVLLLDPTLGGYIETPVGVAGYLKATGYLWLVVGVAGLLFRVLQLTARGQFMIAIAWLAKIITDPFHDFATYRRAPAALLRGELFDPDHGRPHRA